MTNISAIDHSHTGRVDFNETSRHGSSRKSASLGQIMKTAAMLALTLTGGAQARSVGDPVRNRNLMEMSSYMPPGPFKYDSLCNEPGMLDKIRDGMNYEDCMAEENAAIDDKKNSKGLKVGKMCSIISASIMGTGTVVGGLSLIPRTEAGKSVSILSFVTGALAVVPASFCYVSYSNAKDELSATREVAVKCCKSFPKKSEVAKVIGSSMGVESPQGEYP